MKANFIKKITLLSIASGSFLVFGGLYQTIKINDLSYMKDSEVKFVKRFDENKERIVASNDKISRAIHYVPVNLNNQNILNGKWEIVRVEDEKGESLLDANNGDNSKVVDLELVATSQIRINGDDKYLFDISFLHQEGKNIALFRSFGTGFELIEARRIKEVVSEVAATEEMVEEVGSPLEIADTEDKVELSLERAMIPSLSNVVIVGEEFVSGEVSIANGSIQGLTFSVVNKEKKEVAYAIPEIQIQDGGSFQVEIDGIESAGVVTNNGKDSYRIRFATGPLQGSLLNFVTDQELERLKEEVREVEELKEEKAYETESVAATEVNEEQAEIAEERKEVQKNVIDAGYKEKVRAELEEELREEIEMEYEVEGIEGEENIVAEVSRHGYSF